MRISAWSSDVCSSDPRPAFLTWPHVEKDGVLCLLPGNADVAMSEPSAVAANLLGAACELVEDSVAGRNEDDFRTEFLSYWNWAATERAPEIRSLLDPTLPTRAVRVWRGQGRSEEHTSELQSLMRISYAVFCLKKKKITQTKRSIRSNHTQS